MKRNGLRILLAVVLSIVVVLIGATLTRRLRATRATVPQRGAAQRIVPVEVAEVARGRLERRRTFSGTLTAAAEMRIAPKISGRIARILVDLSDPVARGAEVAIMDDAEFRQAVTSAEADLAVARAQAAEAANRLALARRELERITTLEERGVASAAALDTAQSEFTMRQSAAEVAEANLLARAAALATAQIRLGYTRVTANWTEGDNVRVIAERFVDEGDTVAANTPLLAIVSLRPIRAVFYVPERDYALLQTGQTVTLRTDAFPGEEFPGTIARIAPVFREDSRQARVEVSSPNTDERLKPGMFVRASVVLETADDTKMVPITSIVRRGGEQGVFQINDDHTAVVWTPVSTGIANTTHIAIQDPDLAGQVVTLGHQFLGDGSAIRIVKTGRILQ
ncbi:MAG: efflux RND transporter periplasmic adaptor subunit [Kiritimatiellia bacterium]